MATDFNLRSLFSICLVLVLHSAMFYLLLPKNTFLARDTPQARSLHYVSIIEPKSLLTFSSKPKPGKINRPAIQNSSNDNLASTSALINPAIAFRQAPSNDLPKLDLDNLRASAVQGELNRERSPIELQEERNRRNLSLEARVENGASKAQRSDCRKSYAQTGLFAALFIARDVLNDKGCKF